MYLERLHNDATILRIVSSIRKLNKELWQQKGEKKSHAGAELFTNVIEKTMIEF